MKICFMGTGDFAFESLNALLNNEHKIFCVYTKQPHYDKKGNIVDNNLYNLAKKHNITIKTPLNFKNNDDILEFEKEHFDLAIVVSYGLILPKVILNSPKHGCINVHGSVLPKYRGASPIHATLLNGDSIAGVTTIQMDAGVDTGDILLQDAINVEKTDTFSILYNKLAILGSKLLLKTIEQLTNNTLNKTVQNNTEASYTKIISKLEGKLDFNKISNVLVNQIKAFEVFPTSYFYYNNEIFKVISATSVNNIENINSGTIISNNPLLIKCKEGSLQVNIIQKQGKKPMLIKDFSNGFTFDVNSVLK